MTGNLRYIKGYREVDHGNSVSEGLSDETDGLLDAYSRAVVSVMEKLSSSY